MRCHQAQKPVSCHPVAIGLSRPSSQATWFNGPSTMRPLVRRRKKARLPFSLSMTAFWPPKMWSDENSTRSPTRWAGAFGSTAATRHTLVSRCRMSEKSRPERARYDRVPSRIQPRTPGKRTETWRGSKVLMKTIPGKAGSSLSMTRRWRRLKLRWWRRGTYAGRPRPLATVRSEPEAVRRICHDLSMGAV